jgi:hypothetical protein
MIRRTVLDKLVGRWMVKPSSDGRGTRDGILIDGKIVLDLYDPDGNLKQHIEEDNMVVNTGLAYIADALSLSPGDTVMTHMEVGSGGEVLPSAADTQLSAALARVALTGSTPTDSGAVVTFTATFSAGVGTGALDEAGIFNNAVGGTMLCRATYDVVNKAAGDSLDITWTLTFTDN